MTEGRRREAAAPLFCLPGEGAWRARQDPATAGVVLAFAAQGPIACRGGVYAARGTSRQPGTWRARQDPAAVRRRRLFAKKIPSPLLTNQTGRAIVTVLARTNPRTGLRPLSRTGTVPAGLSPLAVRFFRGSGLASANLQKKRCAAAPRRGQAAVLAAASFFPKD